MSEWDIEICNVTWTYKGSITPAIKNIDLKVRRGEIILVTGPSGAGKTTFCRLLNGLIPHFYEGELTGTVKVKGLDTTEYSEGTLAGVVGLLFDNPTNQLFCNTVRTEIAFGPENYGVPVEEIKRRVKDCIEFCRLQEYEDKNPHYLSGGEQQSCALASVIAMQPSIYALDEPTSNLDPLGTTMVFERIFELVKKERKTLIITEHKLEELVLLCDRLMVLNKGEILLDGKPQDILQQANIDMLSEIGVYVPQVTLLAHKLRSEEYKIDNLPLTLEEGHNLFLKMLKGKEISRLTKPKKTTSRVSEEPIIALENVCYSYPDGTLALRDTSLKIYQEEFVGLIGCNGAGKTTLAKIMNGLYKPSSGKAIVFGKNTSNVPTNEIIAHVGYCFQNPDDQIFEREVKNELKFGLKNIGLKEEEIEKRVAKIAKTFGLEDYLDKNPFSLSQGLRQRLAVASVMAMNPEIIIVDEPTTGQDYRTSRSIMKLALDFNKAGRTVIIISHNIPLIAEYCSRCIVMGNGKILLDGPTREVLSKTKVLKKASLKPPQVTMLGQSLRNVGMPNDVLTVDEMFNVLSIEIYRKVVECQSM